MYINFHSIISIYKTLQLLFNRVRWQQNLDIYKIRQFITNINRGYYTAARRYDIYHRVVKTIFYERAQRVSKILFLTREDKSHIFKPPCNMFCLLYSPKQENVKFHAQKQIGKSHVIDILTIEYSEDMENMSLCIFQYLTLYYIINSYIPLDLLMPI
jgi:hypothetical protein